MKEEYKICPYCNNAVDKKDKQCPYCLKSLSWRSGVGNYNNNSRNNNTNSNTSTEDYDTNSYNTHTIRDDKQTNKNGELSPLFQKFLDLQKAGKSGDKEARKKIIKYIIIFYVLIQLIPIIIETIRTSFGE